MKKFISLMLSICMLLSITVGIDMTAFATTYSGTCGANGSNLTWSLDTETGVLKISGTGAMKDYSVWGSSQKAPWRSYSANITSAIIENGVTSIGGGAFGYCSKMESISLPNTLEKISGEAFYQSGLKSIQIPSSVKSLDSLTFYYCSQLNTVTIPEHIEIIPESCFSECYNLEKINLPNNLLRIESNAFSGCRNLTNIEFPKTLIFIGDSAFTRCEGLAKAIIPDSVTTIERGAFSGCSALSVVSLPVNLTRIEETTFNECTSIDSIIIPENVDYIGNMAFYGCENLFDITIPDDLYDINFRAFDKTAYINDLTNWENGLLYIGKCLFGAKKDINSAIVKNGTISLGQSAFENCTELTSLVLPSSLKYIKHYAFRNTGLTSIEIPDSVEYLGEWLFRDSANLESIVLGDNVKYIGMTPLEDTAYFNNSSNWDNGILYLGKYLVAAKSEITEANIRPDTLIICPQVFYSCAELKTAVIPDSVTRIYDGTFYMCSSLENVTMSKNITAIDGWAFAHCYPLKEFTIPITTKYIGECAFSNDFALTDIHYGGTSEDKEKIEICDYENDYLKNAKWHIFDPEITIQPTCLNEGLKTYKCSACDDSYTEVMPITDHSVVIDSAVEPTCKNTGLTEGSHCSVCNKVFKAQESVDALGHDYVEKITPATFNGQGVYEVSCIRCGNLQAKSIIYYLASVQLRETNFIYDGTQKTPDVWARSYHSVSYYDIDPEEYHVVYNDDRTKAGKHTLTVIFDHKYEATKDLEYIVKPKATYITSVESEPLGIKVNWHILDNSDFDVEVDDICVSGYQIQYSKDSNFLNVSTVEVDDSNTNEKIITDLSCKTEYFVRLRTYFVDTDGTKYYSSWSDKQSAKTLVDEYVLSSTKKATCTEGGYYKYTCKCGCGNSYKEDIPAKGHVENPAVIENKVDSTCITDGSYDLAVYCSVCNKVVSRTTITEEALGHVEVIDDAIDATCMETGLTVGKHCSRCEEILIEQSIVDALGHDEVVDEKMDATCLESGLTEGKHCSRCGEILVKQERIEPIGHDFTSWSIVTTPTQCKEGLSIRICNNCNEIEKLKIDPLGEHSYEEKVTAPTCTVDGFTTYVCSACGDSYTSDYVEATGHQHTEILEYCGPSCIEKGYTEGERCLDCGTTLVYQEEIQPLGHSWDSGVVTKNATCSEEGVITYTCTVDVCKATKTEPIAKIAHTQKTITNTVNPTCTKDGEWSEILVCEVCGEELGGKGDIIPATGHTEVADKAVAPTCSKTGLTAGSHCSVCGEIIVAQKPTAKTAHTYKNVVTKATTKANGKITPTCSVCSATKTATAIYYPKTVTLSKTSYVYDGKAKKPTVTVKDSNGNTISISNYSVSYSNNTKAGQATVKITFKGNYSGTISKTFTITPKATIISSVSTASKAFTVKWKKQATETTGYEIQYSTDKNFKKGNKTVTVSKNSTTSKKVTGLKSKTKYYVHIRTYKTVKVNGKSTKIYSTWSKATVVTTKK